MEIQILDIATEAFAVLSALVGIIACAYSVISYAKNSKLEQENRNKRVNKIYEIENKQDVLALMFDNVGEMREYYQISKSQAKATFRSALLSCFFGFLIYLIGIASVVTMGKDVSTITIISGTVLELVSGTTFILYYKSLSQLNTYHRRLEKTEKYLIAYHMINEVPEDKKYKEQRKFIEKVFSDSIDID